MPGTETLQLTDGELLDSLRNFPGNVLPVGVLRELTKRGPNIQDEVLRRLDTVASQAGIGVGSLPQDCLFCFGLLIAHPCMKQLPTLERLLRLDRDILDRLASELIYSVPLILLAEIAIAEGTTDVFAWLDRMLEDDSIGEPSAGVLVSVFPYLVRRVIMPRDQAIERLIGLLRRRESQKYDMLSACAILELSNLGAAEQDAFVNECFDREQIDEDFYCRDDWQLVSESEGRLQQLKELKPDLLEQIQWWHCFSEVSDSLNPFEATIEPNAERLHHGYGSSLTASEIDSHFQSLRKSNDRKFPREAVEAFNRNIVDVKERLIGEVRDGLAKAGGPEARASNAPFLALALLIAREVKIPRDLLLRIVDLPEDHCMDLFGDAMGDAIAVALSLSLQGDMTPIDARITDTERSDIDRGVLAQIYPLSAWRGHLRREDAIERLFGHWQSTLSDELGELTMLSDSLLCMLCVMSPQQHRDELRQAVEDQDGSRHFSQQRLLELLENPSRGDDEAFAWIEAPRNVIKIIESSVMFDQASLHPEQRAPVALAPPLLPTGTLETKSTIRNTTPPAGRNDACPCGSGKKYKKCCLRK
jgi:hypothetical protein